jgi:hypothetical protein
MDPKAMWLKAAFPETCMLSLWEKRNWGGRRITRQHLGGFDCYNFRE